MNQILVVMILFAAVICDIWAKKIPNSLVLVGYGLGGTYLWLNFGFAHLYYLPLRALWPVLALYIFYYFGGVGAGDLKLISCMSVFLPTFTTLNVIICSFVLAAVYALGKLLYKGKLFLKLAEVREYINVSIMTGNLYAYETDDNDSLICFSIFIAAGFAISYFLGVII